MELSHAIQLIKSDQISQNSGNGLFTFALAHLLKPGSIVQGVDKIPARFNYNLQPEGVQIRSVQLDFENIALLNRKSPPTDFSERGHPKNQLLKTSIVRRPGTPGRDFQN